MWYFLKNLEVWVDMKTPKSLKFQVELTKSTRYRLNQLRTRHIILTRHIDTSYWLTLIAMFCKIYAYEILNLELVYPQCSCIFLLKFCKSILSNSLITSLLKVSYYTTRCECDLTLQAILKICLFWHHQWACPPRCVLDRLVHTWW